MKKTISIILTLTVVMALLAGCAGKPATSQPAGGQDQTAEENNTPDTETNTGAPVKTGLSMVVNVSKSEDPSAEGDGSAQANISLVAVTVGDDGVIDDCVIDAIQSKIGFNTAGQLTTDPATTFASKNELGEAYGLKKASSIGKEWNEQAAAMAEYAVGKTVEELKGIAVNENGAPAEADLAASVTLSIGDFIAGIEDAVNNAQHLGAKAGDELKLTTTTDMSNSKDASAEGDGLVQADAIVAAVTFDGDTITSCCIDAAQASVNFNTEGVITTDLAAEQPTKNQLGEAYGMKKASSIGKEWNEQAAAFCAYVTGKTADEVSAIAVNEWTSPADADLAASVTIGIGDFQALIAKAAE